MHGIMFIDLIDFHALDNVATCLRAEKCREKLCAVWQIKIALAGFQPQMASVNRRDTLGCTPVWRRPDKNNMEEAAK
jgi:hypothetical protein